LGIDLQVQGVGDPAVVLVPGGLAVAGGCVGWWWLRHLAGASTRERWRALRRFPTRGAAVGAAGVALGVAQHAAGWTDPGIVMIPGGLATAAGCTGWWWLRWVARPHSTRAAITRRAELDQRAGGVATWLDVAELAGPTALRRRAPVLRPTTAAALPRRARRRMDPRELGVEIARLGWGLPGQRVWSSVEETTLRIAPPRAGKTISMACHAWDAPGALITTSTRLDLAEMVHAARTARGAVYFFNPSGMGGIATTLRWRVLGGCEDFTAAQRRASDLMPIGASAEAERWDGEGRRLLAILLHAGAVSGRGMRDVVRWNSEPGDRTRTEVELALLAGGPGGRDRIDAMRQHWATNERTRTSVTATLNAPLAWVRDERTRPLGDFPADDVGQVDLRDLILRGHTLHLLGREEQTGTAPLIAALVAEIADTARRLAEDRPGGRLDPPLTMVLDEIAIVCPIPLDTWSADMGGKGVTLHAAVQSLSQLRQRWGADGAGTICGNVNALVVFGGSVSPDDLRDLSQLTGEHRMRVIGVDHDRVDDGRDGELRGEYRWVPVMSPSQIRDLQPLQVLVLKRDLHALVGWTPKIMDRSGWRMTNLRRIDPLEAEITTTAGGNRARARGLVSAAWALLTGRPAPVPTAAVTGQATGAATGPAPHAVPVPRTEPTASADPTPVDLIDVREVDTPAEASRAAREALNRWTRPAPQTTDAQNGADTQNGTGEPDGASERRGGERGA